MPSTFVHGLLPSACLAFSHRSFSRITRPELLKLVAAALVIGNLPDLDLIPATLFPSHWEEIHRAWGHNIFSLAVWTWMGQWAIRRWAVPTLPRKTAWRLSAFLVCSHVFLDAMSYHPEPYPVDAGVPLLWPFFSRKFSLPFSVFPGVDPAIGTMNPLLAHIVSTRFWESVFATEMLHSAALFGGFAVLYTGYRWIASGRINYPGRVLRWRSRARSLRERANSRAASNSSGSSK